MDRWTWVLVCIGCSSSHGPGSSSDGGVLPPPDCRPTAERCNGSDDDCDGRADEGASSTCLGEGQACIDGACGCPPENLCGGECVDVLREPDHCGACGTPCPGGLTCADGRCCVPRGDDVDLLFVIDNSGSMNEEQTNLVAQLPRMLRMLATGDLGLDGVEDFPAVRSLQLGVVTTDMGTGGFLVPTCADAGFGDDGVLRSRGNTAIPGCAASYPAFLEYRAGGPSGPVEVASALTCVAAMGTNGCGFEQHLEAMLKALTPSSSAIEFVDGTRGHADVVNAGFVRRDSMLAVIVLSDEEDCSAMDPDIFNPTSRRYTGDLNLRCFQYPDAVHPVQRYVEGLLAVRDPSRLVFAPIVGIPDRLLGQGFDTILADPDMQEMIDPAMPTRLRPSCNRPGTGLAFPPRRIVATAQALDAAGAAVDVGSICVDDFSSTIGAIIAKLGERAVARCD